MDADRERDRELKDLLEEVRALRKTLDELKREPRLPPDYAVLARTFPQGLPPDYAVAVRIKPELPPDYAVLVRPMRPGEFEEPIQEQ